MWNKIKPFFIAIGGVILLIIGFMLGRGKSDRSGVSDVDGSIDQLGDGIDRAADENSRLGEHLANAERSVRTVEEITRDINEHNRAAIDGVRTAQDILREARERSMDE